MNTGIQNATRQAPKLGVIVNSNGVFNPSAKQASEHSMRALVDKLKQEDGIAPDSFVIDHLDKPTEALDAADRLAEAQVDAILIVNIAFPNGQVFLTVATHPWLAKVPIAVAAEPEATGGEWEANAWCGVIMNNHVAKQIGRPICALKGPFGGPGFLNDLKEFLSVSKTVKYLHRDFLARFGDAPGGFHSATGDQILFAKHFGTRVDTIDLTAVWEVFKSGQAKGYLGETKFSEEDVASTVAAIREGRRCEVPDEMLAKAARLYLAFRALIVANGYTSASFRCWPEFNEPYLGVSTCLAMALLMGRGELTAAACEGDWPTAVMQTIGTLLSSRPAACLDWVNYTGGSEVVQLGHCGAGICGSMSCGKCPETVAVHPVLRQAGTTNGPVLVGQFSYGPKTGICITNKPGGGLQMLSFEGESTPETDRGMAYSATDIRVPEYEKLNEMVLEHGFPHHLAVAEGRHNSALKLLCSFLGIEHVSPQ